MKTHTYIHTDIPLREISKAPVEVSCPSISPTRKYVIILAYTCVCMCMCMCVCEVLTYQKFDVIKILTQQYLDGSSNKNEKNN